MDVLRFGWENVGKNTVRTQLLFPLPPGDFRPIIILREKSETNVGMIHTVDGVLGFFSVVRIGTFPPSHPQACVSLPLWFLGGDPLACRRGGGGVLIRTRYRHRGTQVYMYFVV
jgi:hypothetical protein